MDDDERAEEIVSRLRAISSDEKSELGKLRCRIDDQARLIMMLKKRNDEYILANLHLEQQINDRQTQLDLFNEQCHEEQLKDQQLKQLRQTIEQLTNAADQSRLNEQQSQLLLQRSHDQLTEAQQRLDALELTLQQTRETSSSLQNQSMALLAKRDELFNEKVVLLAERERRLTDLEGQLKDKDRALLHVEQIHRETISELTTKISRLEQDRTQSDERFQNSSKEQNQLRQRLNKLQDLLKETQARFENDEQRVNADVRVRQIQSELNDREEQLRNIEQEYLAYKKHATSLLNKEKDLNERLQNLLSNRQ